MATRASFIAHFHALVLFLKLQFTEARQALDEQDARIQEKENAIRLACREKDDLARDNEVSAHGRARTRPPYVSSHLRLLCQTLRKDIERLREVYVTLQEGSEYMQPDTPAAGNSLSSQQDTPEQEHLYESIGERQGCLTTK